MPIIRWKPLKELEDFFEEFPTFRSHSWDLAADIFEDEKNILVHVNLPGINPDKVDIEIEDNHLRVSGSREEEKEVKDKQYYHKEIRRGHFERVITLPSAVAIEQARAEFDNGVLKITLPKSKSEEPKKIRVTRK